MVLAIFAMLAAAVLPQLRDTSGVRLIAAARLLASDLEHAQIMCITRPASPVVVVFEPDKGEYRLAYASDPAVPIPNPVTQAPHVVTFGTGVARGAAGVTMQVSGLTGSALGFNEQGGIDMTFATTAPVIRLRCDPDPRWITLTIAPITGTITEASGG